MKQYNVHAWQHALPKYVWFALAAGVILRLWLLFAAPIQTETGKLPAFNDELSHFNHVLFQRDAGGMPRQNLQYVDDAALATGQAEYWQPPLYYQLSALLLKITGSLSYQLIIIRLFSLLLWYGALLIVAWSVPVPRMRNSILLVGSILGATLPASTVVSNDALLAFFIALLYALSTLASKRILRTTELGLLVVTMGLAVYAKLPAIVLFPMPVVAILINPESKFSCRIRNAVIVAVIAIAITIPLWWLRIQIYGGPLGLRYAPPIGLKQAIAAFCYSLVCPWMEPWSSYWVKIAGVVLTLAMIVSKGWFWFSRKSILSKFDNISYRTSLVWAVGGTVAGIAWLYYAILNYQTEARLLLPATPAIALIVSAPLWSLPEKISNRIGWCVAIMMVLPYLALLR